MMMICQWDLLSLIFVLEHSLQEKWFGIYVGDTTLIIMRKGGRHPVPNPDTTFRQRQHYD